MSSNDRQVYYYCKDCGCMITEEEHDDNDGLCDECYTENQTWNEVPFGCDGY